MTALEDLKVKLIKEWDKADEEMKEKIKSEYVEAHKIGWKEVSRMYQKYGKSTMELMHMTSKDIHEDNCKAAEKTIKNLTNRVEKRIGKIVDAAGVSTNYDNDGLVILNGIFEGENGAVEVQSIRAGGYNIQKMHIRVLIHNLR